MQVSQIHGYANQPEERTDSERAHWITRSNFGRGLLLDRLRWVQPHRKLSFIRIEVDLFPELDRMVVELGLWDWPEPRSGAQRLRAYTFLLACGVRLNMGMTVPDWKRHFRQEQQ